MVTGSTFISVKLASALVDDARAAALTMRRSMASQIEYWATLGRSLEAAGLTAGDAAAMVDARTAARDKAAASMADAADIESLKTHVVTLVRSGALARRARKAVAANAARAARPARKARRAR